MTRVAFAPASAGTVYAALTDPPVTGVIVGAAALPSKNALTEVTAGPPSEVRSSFDSAMVPVLPTSTDAVGTPVTATARRSNDGDTGLLVRR